MSESLICSSVSLLCRPPQTKTESSQTDDDPTEDSVERGKGWVESDKGDVVLIPEKEIR